MLNCHAKSALHLENAALVLWHSITQWEFQRKPEHAVRYMFVLGASRRVFFERDCCYLSAWDYTVHLSFYLPISSQPCGMAPL